MHTHAHTCQRITKNSVQDKYKHRYTTHYKVYKNQMTKYIKIKSKYMKIDDKKIIQATRRNIHVEKQT